MGLDARQISAFDQTTEVTFNGLVEPVVTAEEREVTPTEENKTTTETRAQEAKKEGGCMKIFAMVLQVVAAVVAVVGGPQGLAIAAALNAAAKAMTPQESTSSSANRETFDLNRMQREQETDSDRYEAEYRLA